MSGSDFIKRKILIVFCVTILFIALNKSPGFCQDIKEVRDTLKEAGEEEYLSTYRYYYKIDLFSISDEMYYFFENKSLAGNNILGNIGLAPVYFRKENVSGGFGVLGCCSRATSGWLPNLNPMPDYNDLEEGKRLIHDWLADFMHQAQ